MKKTKNLPIDTKPDDESEPGEENIWDAATWDAVTAVTGKKVDSAQPLPSYSNSSSMREPAAASPFNARIADPGLEGFDFPANKIADPDLEGLDLPADFQSALGLMKRLELKLEAARFDTSKASGDNHQLRLNYKRIAKQLAAAKQHFFIIQQGDTPPPPADANHFANLDRIKLERPTQISARLEKLMAFKEGHFKPAEVTSPIRAE